MYACRVYMSPHIVVVLYGIVMPHLEILVHPLLQNGYHVLGYVHFVDVHLALILG